MYVDGRKETDILDEIVNFVIGSAENPVLLAIYFLFFVVLVDSIFGVANNLVSGARR